MANPIYGSSLAGYMDILAGQARGMNEAERLRRMQEQQDFSRAMQAISFQDQTAAREQNRADQYGWNVYNAMLNQQRMQRDQDWNAYDRLFQEKQFSRQEENDQWRRQMDMLRMTPRQQTAEDMLKELQARQEIATMAQTAMNPEDEQSAIVSAALNVPAVPEKPSGLWNMIKKGANFTWRNPTSPLGWIDRIRKGIANSIYGEPITKGMSSMFNYKTEDELRYDAEMALRNEMIRRRYLSGISGE